MMTRTPVPVRCLLRSGSGVRAPCIDDLCRSGGPTICGLYPNEDFCEHGYYPDTCDTCYPDGYPEEGWDEEPE